MNHLRPVTPKKVDKIFKEIRIKIGGRVKSTVEKRVSKRKHKSI